MRSPMMNPVDKPQTSSSAEIADAPLMVGGIPFRQRLLMGSGRYSSLEIMQAALVASETDGVTVAVRRERLSDGKGRNVLDFLNARAWQLIPNTAGCYDAATAIRCAKMGREILRSIEARCIDLVKLEVLGDSHTLLPDPLETLKATEELVALGFKVMCYCSDDPILARRLYLAGAAAVMPAGSPIGSGGGVSNPNHLRIIIEDLKARQENFPVIVDAGIRTPSDVARAMEIGADAVLLNSAVAKSRHPIAMARAMSLAARAGRAAFLAGPMVASRFAAASSPEFGVITSKSSVHS